MIELLSDPLGPVYEPKSVAQVPVLIAQRHRGGKAVVIASHVNTVLCVCAHIQPHHHYSLPPATRMPALA